MEIQTHPYEILVRFSCEPGEVAGAIRGMHMVTAAYAVDEDGKIVGTINRGAEDLAKETTQAEVARIIGAVAVTTEISHRAEVEALKANHKAEAEELQAKIFAMTSELELARAELTDANVRIAATATSEVPSEI